MKRIPLSIASVALILSLGTVNALAAGHHGYQSYAGSNANGARNGLGRNFVDENSDGVCDFYGSGRNFVDENDDGICDFYGSGHNFVDENGDGVCDFYDSGRNFVDENGDGVCDNGSSCCSGYGMQYRWRQNR